MASLAERAIRAAEERNLALDSRALDTRIPVPAQPFLVGQDPADHALPHPRPERPDLITGQYLMPGWSRAEQLLNSSRSVGAGSVQELPSRVTGSGFDIDDGRDPVVVSLGTPNQSFDDPITQRESRRERRARRRARDPFNDPSPLLSALPQSAATASGKAPVPAPALTSATTPAPARESIPVLPSASSAPAPKPGFIGALSGFVSDLRNGQNLTTSCTGRGVELGLVLLLFVVICICVVSLR